MCWSSMSTCVTCDLLPQKIPAVDIFKVFVCVISYLLWNKTKNYEIHIAIPPRAATVPGWAVRTEGRAERYIFKKRTGIEVGRIYPEVY